MEHKVVPLVIVADNKAPAQSAAAALENLIKANTQDGWEYHGVHNHNTHVAGDTGCFGIGATAAYQQVYALVVFRR